MATSRTRAQQRWTELVDAVNAAYNPTGTAGGDFFVATGLTSGTIRMAGTVNAVSLRAGTGAAGDNSSLAAITARLSAAKFDADDHAILDRLIATTTEVERCFREFEFSAAVQVMYGFFWNDFCDWYVEVSKSKLQASETKDNCLAIQDLVLRQTLLLLHPVIPFITEELWHQLGYGAEEIGRAHV